MEKSIQFYEKLGLMVTTPMLELDEEEIARAFQLPKGHLKVVHLAPSEATSGMFIDLVQWIDPPSAGESYPALDHVGINRLAFRVSDIDGTVALLQEQGIAFLSEAPQSFGGIRTIVTTDPDGVFIQLLEWL
ncbi:MAG: VOC family protein [Caldilineaceae bacterium]|nr:VOC family protein [Caldilineaceae bacterium]